ncbi:Uncharacterised protein [Mycobacterium tuberculosis]|nr:Uncharacterised protein [Mycobacterium tuberculosis]
MLPWVNWAIEMTFTWWAIGGRIIDSTWVGRSVVPIIRGIEWPWISASSTPIDRPRTAIAAARLTVTVDFPTPPLPEATAYTRVKESGCANGMTGSRVSPRNCLRSSVRCSSLITSKLTRTAEVPGTSATARVTRSVISDFFGQPAMVR